MLRAKEECIPCPMGWFCDGSGTKKKCKAGFFCARESEDATGGNALCPEGFFCDQSVPFPLPCPEGTLGKIKGLKNRTQCVTCPSGSFCQGLGQKKATGECPAGFFCGNGSVEPRVSGKSCRAGQECPKGSGAPKICTGSKFSKWDFAEKCEDCPARFACKDGEDAASVRFFKKISEESSQ